MQEVRFAKSARRHRIGKAHVRHVIATVEPEIVPAGRYPDDLYVWVGEDDRGLELEVVAAVKPDCLLVIHVMPTDLHRR